MGYIHHISEIMQNTIITILKASLLAYLCSELSQHVAGENLRSVSRTRKTAKNNKRNLHGIHYTKDGPVAVDHSSDDTPAAEGEASADDADGEASADDVPAVAGEASADDVPAVASADDTPAAEGEASADGVPAVASADDSPAVAGEASADDVPAVASGDDAGDAPTSGLIVPVAIDDD